MAVMDGDGLMATSGKCVGAARIVVLGSKGFIGGSLMRYLNGLGVSAVGLDHSDVDASDEAALTRMLRSGDVVINAVGYAAAGDESATGRHLCTTLNVDVPVALASACATVGAHQLIHLSSVAAMGRLTGLVSDVDAMGPLLNSYAKSKKLAEVRLQEFSSRLPITVLRPTSVFGRGRPLARQLCRLASLPVVPLPAGGTALVPFTHVGNVSSAVTCAVAQPATYGKTFIVGDTRSYSLRFLIEHLRSDMHARGVTLPIRTGLFRAALDSVNLVCEVLGRPPVLDAGKLLTLTTSVEYDVSAFVNATGYAPTVSVEMGLADIAAWYHERASQ